MTYLSLGKLLVANVVVAAALPAYTLALVVIAGLHLVAMVVGLRFVVAVVMIASVDRERRRRRTTRLFFRFL